MPSRSVFVVLLSVVLSACDNCPRLITAEAISPLPSRRYTALAYERSCGVLSDFNRRLGLKETSLRDTDEVMRIFNIDWAVRLEWLAHDRLQVVFGCPHGESVCGVGDRHWTAEWRTEWRDVHITYAASDELRRGLSAADLRRLPFDPSGVR